MAAAMLIGPGQVTCWSVLRWPGALPAAAGPGAGRAGASCCAFALRRPLVGGLFGRRREVARTAVRASSGVVPPPARPLLIYDSTLTQREAEFSVEDRVKVAKMLDDFGMHYIEAGWPTVNPADRLFFVRAHSELGPQCFRKLVAMAPLGDDKSPTAVSEALLKTGAMCVGVAVNVAAMTPDSGAVEKLEETLGLLRQGEPEAAAGRTVIVQLHNAMHAYKNDAALVVSILSAICKSKAGLAIMVDSGGTATPWEVEEMVRHLQDGVQWGETKLGVGCREQAELAVAASLYAARQGAEVLAGTMNGFGCGLDLASLVPILQLKMGHQIVAPDALAGLTRLSRAINEQVSLSSVCLSVSISNMMERDEVGGRGLTRRRRAINEQVNLPHRNSQPFVGQSAFAHKGGIHVAAVLKNEDSYQHIDPRVVGNQRRVLISELSGRGNIMSKVE